MIRRAGFGWLELAIGMMLIVLGILALARPDFVLDSMVFAYGIAAVVMGVADIILYIRVERYTGFGPILSMISGILSVMTGVMLMVYPRAGVLVLTVLFPIWFIAHCIYPDHQHHRADSGMPDAAEPAAHAGDHPQPCRRLPHPSGNRRRGDGIQPDGHAVLR